MRIIFLAVILVFIVACGEDSFKKAEMSECLNNTADTNVIIQPKVEITEETDEMVVPDEENDDSDIVEETPIHSVILKEKSKAEISFYYQTNFACSGVEYGYDISLDSSDSTSLVVNITSKDTDSNSSVKCLCFKKMTINYSNDSVDLTEVIKVKIIFDDFEADFSF